MFQNMKRFQDLLHFSRPHLVIFRQRVVRLMPIARATSDRWCGCSASEPFRSNV